MRPGLERESNAKARPAHGIPSLRRMLGTDWGGCFDGRNGKKPVVVSRLAWRLDLLAGLTLAAIAAPEQMNRANPCGGLANPHNPEGDLGGFRGGRVPGAAVLSQRRPVPSAIAGSRAALHGGAAQAWAIEHCHALGCDFAIARLESVRAQAEMRAYGLSEALSWPGRLDEAHVDEATRALAPQALIVLAALQKVYDKFTTDLFFRAGGAE